MADFPRSETPVSSDPEGTDIVAAWAPAYVESPVVQSVDDMELELELELDLEYGVYEYIILVRGNEVVVRSTEYENNLKNTDMYV